MIEEKNITGNMINLITSRGTGRDDPQRCTSRSLGENMKLAKYNANNAAEIEKLFVTTFSDSEGQAEGELIGSLVKDFMDNTDTGDLYCFVATEIEPIAGKSTCVEALDKPEYW